MEYTLLIDERVVNHHKLALDIKDAGTAQNLANILGESQGKSLDEIREILIKEGITYNIYKDGFTQEVEDIYTYINLEDSTKSIICIRVHIFDKNHNIIGKNTYELEESQDIWDKLREIVSTDYPSYAYFNVMNTYSKKRGATQWKPSSTDI